MKSPYRTHYRLRLTEYCTSAVVCRGHMRVKSCGRSKTNQGEMQDGRYTVQSRSAGQRFTRPERAAGPHQMAG